MLAHPDTAALIQSSGLRLVTHAVRKTVDGLRQRVLDGGTVPDMRGVIDGVRGAVHRLRAPTLKRVINATGIVLHTNLGRAPLGRQVLEDIAPVVLGYSNLEFDLETGQRGHRSAHVEELLRYLTGAEDVVVVNNNAAGIILTLNTLAKEREVIVSRGELIEIGGAFRIPEIMAAGGCSMVEVGTTNRTRIADYEAAITPRTALLFKAHKSNYAIKGFTEEADLDALAECGRKHGIPFVYDIGSGLLRKPDDLPLESEPDVADSLAKGADLVMFSCDKLLGGPQAGIVAGRKELVAKLAKAPLMRALRVGKITMAALASACRAYLTDESLTGRNPAFAMLSAGREVLQARASRLHGLLTQAGVTAEIIENAAQCGGGTLPELEIPSYAVRLSIDAASGKAASATAEKACAALMRLERPVVGILREGRLLFDVLTIVDDEIPVVAESVASVLGPRERR